MNKEAQIITEENKVNDNISDMDPSDMDTGVHFLLNRRVLFTSSFKCCGAGPRVLPRLLLQEGIFSNQLFFVKSNLAQ